MFIDLKLSLLIYFTLSQLVTSCNSAITAMVIRSIDFEIFGRVQGVFFRKFTKDQADKLGLKGWCRNTSQGTVLGHIQGAPDNVDSMKDWLKTTGSPSSVIQKAEFRNQKDIDQYTFDNFEIIRGKD